jgi:hypothetical protein
LRQRDRNEDSNEQRGAKAAAQSFPLLLAFLGSSLVLGYVRGETVAIIVWDGKPVVRLSDSDFRVCGDCSLRDSDRRERLRLGFMVASVAAR